MKLDINTVVGVAMIVLALFLKSGGGSQIGILSPPVGTEVFVSEIKTQSLDKKQAAEMGPLLVEISNWIAKNPGSDTVEITYFCDSINDNLDILARDDAGIDPKIKEYLRSKTSSMNFNDKQSVVNDFYNIGKALSWYGGASIKNDAQARISTFIESIKTL